MSSANTVKNSYDKLSGQYEITAHTFNHTRFKSDTDIEEIEKLQKARMDVMTAKGRYDSAKKSEAGESLVTSMMESSLLKSQIIYGKALAKFSRKAIPWAEEVYAKHTQVGKVFVESAQSGDPDLATAFSEWVESKNTVDKLAPTLLKCRTESAQGDVGTLGEAWTEWLATLEAAGVVEITCFK
ncbi:hypothetical protein I302_105690 [Kwoniella bestiolae CBS 10118]|uniref:Uncharacterized protein n=1 Tax=Kwoniella bestiolae CBS 10118 TaxID=1296100 RepID=A0A1B9G1V7_9TREE|nr:hypothetical protein I302_04810 [Kwoniella bestiolae CBS 10118]OCF25000.1 hypothetical protein I302_04810 [Kwoniella bestiolae CBS 10118]